MTPAHRLLAELARRGVSIHLDGTHVRLYPRSALTDGLIGQLHESRAEILTILRSRQFPTHAAVPALHPLHWWLLCALAHTPRLTRDTLYSIVAAPQPVIDRALSALLHSRELRAAPDGRLDLNAY